ncbi:MAG: isopenicillin N synthase family dioxygenase [Ilumatobacter sp.]
MLVPVIDISDFATGSNEQRAAIGAAIDRACREVGFFSVVGHGVDEAVINEAHRMALRFFDLALSERRDAEPDDVSYPYGYRPFSVESLNRSIGGAALADLKETMNIGPVGEPARPRSEMTDADERAVFAPNLWPAALPELRPAIEAYYDAMADLSATLLDVFAEALGLDAGWFRPFIDQHGSALRLAHYPALDVAPPQGSFRAGAHSDYGTLTILRLDEEPGLQVQSAAGEWGDVDAPGGALVVNLGDLMQRWTNDRWRSTMHRVVVPDNGGAVRRLTMPFFHNANWDALVECIVQPGDEARHEPVEAGPYLMSKFRSTVI